MFLLSYPDVFFPPLQALFVMAVGGGDLLAFGGAGGGAQVTTLLLLAGLASLPVVLSLLEAR